MTDKGIENLSAGIDDSNFFIMPDLSTELKKIEDKNFEINVEVEEKKRFTKYCKRKNSHFESIVEAYTLFEKDIEYVVMDNKVKIVDEQTVDGRRYSDGLHQAIEAKENVKIEDATQTFASVTLQNYFRMYHKLSGMTGTAITEAGEFWDIYKLDVMEIPTNKPIAKKTVMIWYTKLKEKNTMPSLTMFQDYH